MTNKDVTTLEQAMTSVSKSIANLRRFVKALDKFLKGNGLGAADYCTYRPEVIEITDSHGYEIAIFQLHDRKKEQLVYFYVYTDGTVWGENFSGTLESQDSLVNGGCTYIEAAQEVLATVGALKHTELSSQKIDKAIKALGR